MNNPDVTTPAATERLFFALWPSAKTAGEIAACAQAAHALCGGRVMKPETLHMTLAFLGNMPAAEAQQLVEACSGWVIPARTLELRRFGRFTGPRIVWVGPSVDDDDRVHWLDEAYDTLWSYLEAEGRQRPPQIFRPHVSLLRNAGAGDVAALPPPSIVFTPGQCVLVASRPSNNGSRYQVLARLRTV